MSLYPSAPDIFVNRTGSDSIASSDPNNAYDAIENMEGFIGASGAAMSSNSTIIDTIKDLYNGGRCYKKDADEIYVGPFRGIIANAAETIQKLRVVKTVSTLTAADLDTGAFAAATYYYIYATADGVSTEPVFVISASSSAPTGYAFYRRLGWFYNETINVIDITAGIISTFIGGDNDSQTLLLENAVFSTCPTTIPSDDSIPTNTEGNEIMTYPIIPTSTSTKISVEAIVLMGFTAGGGIAALSLFQDAGTAAISATRHICGNSDNSEASLFKGNLSGTGPMLFRIRAGGCASGTLYINGAGASGARIFGGVMITALKIKETKS